MATNKEVYDGLFLSKRQIDHQCAHDSKGGAKPELIEEISTLLENLAAAGTRFEINVEVPQSYATLVKKLGKDVYKPTYACPAVLLKLLNKVFVAYTNALKAGI
ncbi:uncharacterized protein LOC113309203 [Papaver somniferum]|nr:uncharacterized protein LOC113309203 [Papaver somniferum]